MSLARQELPGNRSTGIIVPEGRLKSSFALRATGDKSADMLVNSATLARSLTPAYFPSI